MQKSTPHPSTRVEYFGFRGKLSQPFCIQFKPQADQRRWGRRGACPPLSRDDSPQKAFRRPLNKTKLAKIQQFLRKNRKNFPANNNCQISAGFLKKFYRHKNFRPPLFISSNPPSCRSGCSFFILYKKSLQMVNIEVLLQYRIITHFD